MYSFDRISQFMCLLNAIIVLYFKPDKLHCPVLRWKWGSSKASLLAVNITPDAQEEHGNDDCPLPIIMSIVAISGRCGISSKGFESASGGYGENQRRRRWNKLKPFYPVFRIITVVLVFDAVVKPNTKQL